MRSDALSRHLAEHFGVDSLEALSSSDAGLGQLRGDLSERLVAFLEAVDADLRGAEEPSVRNSPKLVELLAHFEAVSGVDGRAACPQAPLLDEIVARGEAVVEQL